MINFEAIGQAILESATEALGRGARLVEARAKRHAPVRSIFAGTPTPGDETSIRTMSIGESMSQRSAAISAGLPPRTGLSVTTREAPVWWRQRRLANAQSMLAQGLVDRKDSIEEPVKWALSRRGASEVRTRRAVFASWGHLHIGGRLRGEIYSTAPSLAGDRAEAWVISPTPYAKYQEFGTVRNRAHPFLRPAAEESLEDVSSLIAAAVKEASRTSTSTEIEIVVRL